MESHKFHVPNHQPDENDVFWGIFSHQSWVTTHSLFNPLEMMSTISWETMNVDMVWPITMNNSQFLSMLRLKLHGLGIGLAQGMEPRCWKLETLTQGPQKWWENDGLTIENGGKMVVSPCKMAEKCGLTVKNGGTWWFNNEKWWNMVVWPSKTGL